MKNLDEKWVFSVKRMMGVAEKHLEISRIPTRKKNISNLVDIIGVKINYL